MLKILGITGGTIALVVVGVAGAMIVKNNKIPNNLGVMDGKLAEMPSSPNAVSSQTEVEDKYVEPLVFKDTLEKTKTKIVEIVESEGEIIINEDDYIHAIYTTEKMKYKDDVEFYFDTENKLVHFRSASRVGHSDMGLNRERYEKIRDEYNEK